MRRAICLLLCCVSLLLCFGCTEKSPEPQDGIVFYYPQAQLSFQPGSTIIGTETRALTDQETWAQVLSIYFLGPDAEHLLSPFPAGLAVIKTSMENKTVYITVSDHLAELTGLELTMACSCLSLTALALTGAETVVINAEDALLDGQKSITMDKNTLLLLDNWQEE